MWCLPGGKVEYGQTVGDAAVSELKEETTLDVVTLDFLFYQDSLPATLGEMHCINFYFKCEASGNVQLNEESSEYRWIQPSEAKNYMIAFRNETALKTYWALESE